MRETCARVLAAALMTGAIAFSLAMPAVFGTAKDAVGSLTAPPSSIQRSVPVVKAAPARAASAARLEGTRSFFPAIPVAVVTSSADRSSPARAPRSAPRPAPSPAPQPAPATDTRTLAGESAAPPVAQRAPSQPPAASVKRRGKGHDKEKSKPTEPAPQPLPTATPAPPAESPQPDNEKDHGHGNDNGNDKGKGKGGNDKERGG